MKLTAEEKYQFLLSILEVSDLDLWENDGLIVLPKPIYFQFPSDGRTYVSVDEAVQCAMGRMQDILYDKNVQAETDPAKRAD